ncbi:MAG: hypothetical protein BWZ02_02509 [Lentisphaerae bacterium ADurb.BinA184]|nr:MAG: hypothetical protein BWZ02_02509 [Lentisphaerae bacterium ADurb.BinA184]
MAPAVVRRRELPVQLGARRVRPPQPFRGAVGDQPHLGDRRRALDHRPPGTHLAHQRPLADQEQHRLLPEVLHPGPQIPGCVLHRVGLHVELMPGLGGRRHLRSRAHLVNDQRDGVRDVRQLPLPGRRPVVHLHPLAVVGVDGDSRVVLEQAVIHGGAARPVDGGEMRAEPQRQVVGAHQPTTVRAEHHRVREEPAAETQVAVLVDVLDLEARHDGKAVVGSLFAGGDRLLPRGAGQVLERLRHDQDFEACGARRRRQLGDRRLAVAGTAAGPDQDLDQPPARRLRPAEPGRQRRGLRLREGGQPVRVVAAQAGGAGPRSQPAEHVDEQPQAVAALLPVAAFEEDAVNRPGVGLADPAPVDRGEAMAERVERVDAEHGHPPFADRAAGGQHRRRLAGNRFPLRVVDPLGAKALRHAADHRRPGGILKQDRNRGVGVVPAQHVDRIPEPRHPFGDRRRRDGGRPGVGAVEAAAGRVACLRRQDAGAPRLQQAVGDLRHLLPAADHAGRVKDPAPLLDIAGQADDVLPGRQMAGDVFARDKGRSLQRRQIGQHHEVEQPQLGVADRAVEAAGDKLYPVLAQPLGNLGIEGEVLAGQHQAGHRDGGAIRRRAGCAIRQRTGQHGQHEGFADVHGSGSLAWPHAAPAGATCGSGA